MSVAPSLVQAALTAHKAGRLDEAERLYELALAAEPGNADALNLSGMLRLQRGDAPAAAARIAQAARARPADALYQANLAKAKQALGDAAGALACLRHAAELAPANAPFCQQVGLALRALGDHARAAEMFRKAAQAAPRDIAPLNNLAALLLERRLLDEARPTVVAALALDANNPHALVNHGQLLLLDGQAAAALAPLRRAAAADPSNPMTLNSLGVALHETFQTAEAVEVLRRAVTLAPQNPILHVSFGNALKKASRFEEALAAFARALALKPDIAEVHSHIGTCREALLRHDSAIDAYDEALRLKPDYRRARLNRGMARLTCGQFADGWRDYAARDLRDDLAPHTVTDAVPPQEIAGRDILLLGEQGLGDEIFFLRFAAELKRRGAARVSAKVDVKIHGVMSRVAHLDAVITEDAPGAVADKTLIVGDLPLALGMASTDEIPPSLRVAPLAERQADIAKRLSSLGPPPYIGVTWRAGTAERFGMLFKFAPIAEIGGALAGLPGTLLALQRLPQDGEIAALAAAADRPVEDMTALNEDLEAMLALLAALDDYVCVSNTNVHLRAMTGRASRVLVPAPPDFRWMAEGEESPWFPGSRVYRQAADGAWDAALAALAKDMRG